MRRDRQADGENSVTRMRRLALIVLSVWTCGCASLAPRIEPPRATLSSVQMTGLTSEGVTVRIVLDLANGNAQEIRVDALDFSVMVAGVTVASAHSNEPVLLPASGTGQASISATSEFVKWSSAMRRLAGKTSLDYEISGVASVNGRTLPFSRHGEMNTNALSGKPS